GVIHSYDMTATNVNDLHYLKNILWEYHDCMILGDKRFLSASIHQDLFTLDNITLEVPYRLNKKYRKIIKTVFSQLNDHLIMIHIYAKATRPLHKDGSQSRIFQDVAVFQFS
ncbi:MAG: IS982 family transposase, partial [Prevotellaceae bacterium]|nr:IS982 family transposase [Prevotellaceae bacterium]